MPEDGAREQGNSGDIKTEREKSLEQRNGSLKKNLAEMRGELEDCKRARKELSEQFKGLASQSAALLKKASKLEDWLAVFLPLGEPPYNFAVFIAFSGFNDGRRDEARRIFGANMDFRKCYLLLPDGAEIIGTAGKDVCESLEPGQIVLVNGMQSIIGIVPDEDIKYLSAVRGGVVDRVLADVIMVSDAMGFSGRGVVYSNKLREELKEKPLEAGDSVLLFGPCVLMVIERVLGKNKKVNVRPTTLADIGGLGKEIQEIRDVLGLDFSEELKKALKMEAGKGVLLHGPPGVGKTMLVRAIANELHYYFLLVNGADFESMWVGMSQKELRKRLDEALKNKPAIIFFDEVETAFPVRGASLGSEHKGDNLAAFSTFVDGIEDTSGVFIMFSSNRPDKIDPAVIRSGRMDKKIYIPRPNRAGAASILRIYLSRHPIGESGDREEVAKKLINRLVNEIFLADKSTHLFTAFRGSESRPYYFRDFVSGSLLAGIVNEITLRAAKRLQAANVPTDGPECGIISDDLDDVASYKIIHEIPQDDRSRNEWLMVNGYPHAEDFENGETLLGAKNRSAKRRLNKKA